MTDKALRFKSEDVAGEQPVGNIDYTGNDRSTGNVNVAGSSDVAGVKIHLVYQWILSRMTRAVH